MVIVMVKVKAGGQRKKVWFSTGEVARLVGVTNQTVINWCRSGKVKYGQLPSGQFIIPAEEVDKIINGMGIKVDDVLWSGTVVLSQEECSFIPQEMGREFYVEVHQNKIVFYPVKFTRADRIQGGDDSE